MKTKDSISKKKQELSREMQYWHQRIQGIKAEIAFLSEEKTAQAAQIEFCQQEIAKRQRELDSLQTRTRAQINAGWK